MQSSFQMINFIIGVLKFVLITRYILGFRMKKNILKYAFIPMVVVFCAYSYVFEEYSEWLNLYALIFLVIVCFRENIKTSFAGVMMEYLSAKFFDLLIWLLCVSLLSETIDYSIVGDVFLLFSNLVGMVPWIVISCVCVKKKTSMRRTFIDIRFSQYLLIILILISLVAVVSGLQGILLGTIPFEARKIVIILSVVFAIMVAALCALYVYVAESRERLIEINALNEECIESQKNYYQNVMKKDEELRAFKHDVHNHYHALAMMIEDGKKEEAIKYLDRVNGITTIENVYKTGNLMADYIVNNKIKRIKELGEVKVSIIGKFPREMKLDNVEVCIIMANILDNIYEALKDYPGEKELFIEIRNFKQRLFLTFKNSSINKKYKGRTRKKDKENHGYGLKNVNRVVDKYEGNFNTEKLENYFVTTIEL